MDRKGGVLSLKKKKKILDFFLVLFTLKCLAYESLRLVQDSGIKKPISVLIHEVLTNDPLFPACVFNRECQRITRPDGRDLQSAPNHAKGGQASIEIN